MMQLPLFANIILTAKTGLLIRWFKRHVQVWQTLWKVLKPVPPVKKTELKLTNVAKASQEELLEDYRSFLRQRTLPIWEPESETAKIIRQARPETLEQLRQLMARLVSDLSDKSDSSDKNAIKQEVAANTMICLINQETFLLARQLSRLAADFEKDGGFTERLYRIRSEKRKQQEQK